MSHNACKYRQGGRCSYAESVIVDVGCEPTIVHVADDACAACETVAVFMPNQSPRSLNYVTASLSYKANECVRPHVRPYLRPKVDPEPVIGTGLGDTFAGIVKLLGFAPYPGCACSALRKKLNDATWWKSGMFAWPIANTYARRRLALATLMFVPVLAVLLVSVVVEMYSTLTESNYEI